MVQILYCLYCGTAVYICSACYAPAACPTCSLGVNAKPTVVSVWSSVCDCDDGLWRSRNAVATTTWACNYIQTKTQTHTKTITNTQTYSLHFDECTVELQIIDIF